MKRHWTTEELTVHWTLHPLDLALLTNKAGATRLGFALLLKFFQYEARFPQAKNEIPGALIVHLAQQLALPPELYAQYEWGGRTMEYHRAQIREALGFRAATITDADELVAWLVREVLPHEHRPDRLQQAVCERCRAAHIEPPSAGRIERLIRSALHRYEAGLYHTVSERLGAEGLARIDALLAAEGAAEDEGAPTPGATRLTLVDIKADPGRATWTTCWPRSPGCSACASSPCLPISSPAWRPRWCRCIASGPRRSRRAPCVPIPPRYAPPWSPRCAPPGASRPCCDLVREYKASGPAYRLHVQTRLRAAYRRVLPTLLDALTFRSNNAAHQPIIRALDLLRRYAPSKARWFGAADQVPLDEVVPPGWLDAVVHTDARGRERVERINYEICVLQTLREKLRCREVWVEGADRHRNPDADLPADFAEQRDVYYEALHQPREAATFIKGLQEELADALAALDRDLPKNGGVQIVAGKNKAGRIVISPLDPLPEPPTLGHLKGEIGRRWAMISLLDMLKEADLRIGFTRTFASSATREALDASTLQRRLLLCLYALGTNTGLKRVAAGDHGESYGDLRYVRRRYLTRDNVRAAIAQVVNATLAARRPDSWGEGTTACAADSKKFGAWDQNLLTEWSIRHRGPGIMVYRHIERKAVCIYSQIKAVSSSEVAAMIEGVLRHCTAMAVDRAYTDSHGQSEVAFAFSRLLGFQLMPRLKGLRKQKLYRPSAEPRDAYPNLQPVLGRPINWELIRQHYDEMVKFATALRLGTADAEAILRRFTRTDVQHPTYAALVELGRAIKTLWLCAYLRDPAMRREVHEGLQVIENWNGANTFIYYGKGGEIATNRRDEQELAVHCLALVQNALCYLNTLMIQRVLADPEWRGRLSAEDLRGLTPLIYAHVNPYGLFRLDLSERLALEEDGVEVAG